MRGTNHAEGLQRWWRRAGVLGALTLGLALAPSAARAQSAIIYGALSNFDISNDTGKVCHGFEIDMDGVQPSDVPWGGFSANRYGAPSVVLTPTGIAEIWAATYDAATGTWSDRTVQHTVPWFPGQCYQWTGAATYTNSGCEHFGAGLITNPTRVRSYWLREDSAQPGTLVPSLPPTAVPWSTYVVAPVNPPAAPQVPQGQPAQIVAEIPAPEPAEVVGQFGDAQWVRTFVTQLPVEVTLDQLMADNPAVVPMDPAQLESDYAILQDEPPAGGNGKRKRPRHQVNLLPTTRSVVRRIEMWEFTGVYDPITHEALCADGLCNAPAADEIGNLVATQMTVSLVQSDSVTVTKSGMGSGNVDSSDKLIACGSKCVSPYINNALVTLSAKPGSGSTFAGWTGACTSIGSSCTVRANGHVDVGAVFTANANSTASNSEIGRVCGQPGTVGPDADLRGALASTARGPYRRALPSSVIAGPRRRPRRPLPANARPRREPDAWGRWRPQRITAPQESVASVATGSALPREHRRPCMLLH